MWEVLIDGVDRTGLVLRQGFEILKEGNVETMTFTCFDLDLSSAAYTPAHGDVVRAAFGSDLHFGGVVESLTRTRRGGTGVKVQARGWSFDASVRITKTFPAQDLLDLVHDLFETYLEPRGWTWTGATSGGPALPELTFEKQPLYAVFDTLTKQKGYPWRVNGDKVLAWTPAGTLPTPTALTESNATILRGHAIDSSGIRAANRLFAQSGGTGTVAHSESHVGDGTRVCFPVNVEPSVVPTEVTETVSGTPTVYPIGGGRWSWDPDHVAAVKVSGGPLASGDSVLIPLTVERPAWCRAWKAAAVLASGYFNYATVADSSVQAGDQPDVVQLVAWAHEELDRRLISRTIRCQTDTQGWYPWQRGTVTLPSDNVSGDWLVMSTRMQVVGRGDQPPRYTLTLLEDGGSPRWWFDHFRERGQTTTGGVSVGAGGVGSGGGSTGAALLPSGFTIHLGGDNRESLAVSTTARDLAEAIPTRWGGAGMAGPWLLRVPCFQSSAGTLRVRLIDQANPTGALATLTSTKVAANLSYDFDYLSLTVNAPADVKDVLIVLETTAGSRKATAGHCTLVKL